MYILHDALSCMWVFFKIYWIAQAMFVLNHGLTLKADFFFLIIICFHFYLLYGEVLHEPLVPQSENKEKQRTS